MFATLASAVPQDRDLPARAWRLDVLKRVLDGTLYDVLAHEFHEERNGAGEYVPLKDRRPCVRSNLARVVVEDSVALLFGEGRFPAIVCEDTATRDWLGEIAKSARLPQVMADAALRGSIGSVAVLMRVLRGRLFFAALDTLFLTPEFDPQAPDTLTRVTERYKARGHALRAGGYAIPDDGLHADWWFQRVWDADAETWFVPWRVTVTASGDGAGAAPQIDAARTVRHALGFCPLVWVRNLPGGVGAGTASGDGLDGACTFRPAIEAQIEIDYQLSQAGRGLKYASDPLLLIREPAATDGTYVRSAANALVVSAEGDARLLEIGGTAAAAVIEYVRVLRETALEAIHGNRSSADRLTAAQSGRALELLHQPLIWLADRLRAAYGEDALLTLLGMVVAASNRYPLVMRDGRRVPPLKAAAPLALRWPAWFPPTQADKQAEAATLATLRTAGLISRETAIHVEAPAYDIEDVPAEIARIQADAAETDAFRGFASLRDPIGQVRWGPSTGTPVGARARLKRQEARTQEKESI